MRFLSLLAMSIFAITLITGCGSSSNDNVVADATLTISGTTTDADGFLVGDVEVSVMDGTTGDPLGISAVSDTTTAAYTLTGVPANTPIYLHLSKTVAAPTILIPTPSWIPTNTDVAVLTTNVTDGEVMIIDGTRYDAVAGAIGLNWTVNGATTGIVAIDLYLTGGNDAPFYTVVATPTMDDIYYIDSTNPGAYAISPSYTVVRDPNAQGPMVLGSAVTSGVLTTFHLAGSTEIPSKTAWIKPGEVTYFAFENLPTAPLI
jgi:hypothetical protein